VVATEVERRAVEAKAKEQSAALRTARREHRLQLKKLEDAHKHAQSRLVETVIDSYFWSLLFLTYHIRLFYSNRSSFFSFS